MLTVDYSDMDSGQSDIRNKTLAPVFKKIGIIEQWGNGLRLIAEELQAYPEIELSWKEPGIAFRVTFINSISENIIYNGFYLEKCNKTKALGHIFS